VTSISSSAATRSGGAAAKAAVIPGRDAAIER